MCATSAFDAVFAREDGIMSLLIVVWCQRIGHITVVCAALAVLACPSLSRGDSVTSTKSIKWLLNLNADQQISPQGSYDWILGANAVQKPFAPAYAYNPAGNGSMPPVNPGSAQFDASQTLSPQTQSSGTATSGAATAATVAMFSSQPSLFNGILASVATSTTITANVNTPPGSKTGAYGSTSFFVRSADAFGAKITEGGNSVLIRPTQGQNITGANLLLGKFSDPIDLSVYDTSDDQLVATQQLGALNAQDNGNANINWDNTGLTLMAANDGISAATMSLDIGDTDGMGTYAGSWITDSNVGLSTVTLGNGTFMATGYLATLPWQFDSATSPTTASLPAGALDGLTLDYQIPSSAVNPDGMYYEELEADDYAELDESNPVPEPGSAAALLASIIVLSGRRQAAVPSVRTWRD
jgi:hypothetical protein